MRRKRLILLTMILLFALAWRLKNLDWGFPDFFEDTLSLVFLWDIWGVFSGRITLKPIRYDWSPFYYYLIFYVQYVYYLLGRLVGRYPDLTALRLAWVTAPSALYYLGRLVTVAFALGSLGVLDKLGRLFFKSGVVLLALLLFSLDPIFLRYSQTLQTDVPLLFFFLLASYYIVKISEEGRLKHYLFCGIAIGLGTAIKYVPIILILPALGSHFLRASKQSESFFSRKALLLLVLPPLVFFLLLPYSLLDYATFFHWVSYQLEHLQGGHFTNRSRWLFPGTGIQVWWMHLLVLLSTLYFVFNEKKEVAFTYLFTPLLFYLFIIKNATAFDYYLLPVYPFFYLLIADFMMDLARTAGRRLSPSAPGLTTAVCLFMLTSLFLIKPLSLDLRYSQIQGQKSTLSLATEWIEKNIAGKTIIASEIPPPPVQTYRLTAYYFRSAAFVDVIPRLASELAKRPIYYVHLVKLNVFDPGSTASHYNIDNYRLFPYFIVNSSVASRYRKKPQEYPVHNKFYSDISREFIEVARFQPKNEGEEAQITIYQNPNYRLTPKTPLASVSLYKEVENKYRKKREIINSHLTRNGWPRNSL